MTKELFQKAKDLDGRIGVLNYLIFQAERIKDQPVCIVPSNYTDNRTDILGTLREGNPIGEKLSNELVAQLTAERDKLQEEFNNL